MLHIDFETRSTVDLKVFGLDRYAHHPSTEILCMAYAFGDDEVQLWIRGEAFPVAVCTHVQSGGLVAAHNASFEYALWNEVGGERFGWPELRLEQLRCTMAMAYAMGLPGALHHLAPALNCTARKDNHGHRVMLQLCRPKEYAADGSPIWWENPDKYEALYRYCKQDVRTEREVMAKMLPLSPRERKLWVLDQEINLRGIPLDLPRIRKGIALAARAKQALDIKLSKLTGGAVTACTAVKQLTDYIRAKGIEVDGLAKGDILTLLDGPLPEKIREILLLRQSAAKSSTSKLDKMVATADSDGRLRYSFQYHGASTGRWAGRNVQLQNLPRPFLKQLEIEQALDAVDEGKDDWINLVFGDPLNVLSSCLRAMLCAPEGTEFLCADYANIEGRVIAWLAGEGWKLQAFRDFDAGVGPDIYIKTYAESFGVPIEKVTSDQRFIGKIEELALGYQGGVGAFQKMAKQYGLAIPDAEAERIKVAWRDAHPRIVKAWYGWERAAIAAVDDPGVVKTCLGMKFKTSGSFLFVLLPSGRRLCYPYPKAEDGETPWGTPARQLSVMTVDGASRKWGRTQMYGGKWAENFTQAIARDVLAEAMTRLDAAGFPIVLHVHDEIAALCKTDERGLREMESVMRQTPPWAVGLPLATVGWRGQRYRKG